MLLKKNMECAKIKSFLAFTDTLYCKCGKLIKQKRGRKKYEHIEVRANLGGISFETENRTNMS
jgi:hypothetical protein